ncbi:MAG: hypothetical protein CMJ80_16665 [Planctomycetaceae bacterium]|jgi:DUF971 family protein|nr:hypothetical protein [Planctomycetaceae bacterium]
MAPHPTGLQLVSPEELQISWSDDITHTLSVRQLRDHCPCATCREVRGAAESQDPLAVLRPEEAQPLRILGMRPVGNYAYGIQFSDGHDTGIYTLEFLRHLGAGESEPSS